jgi:hypothetical protein
MPMPNINDADRKKPLCYDPNRKKFILFDEIISGEEEIIPIESLSEDDLKKLVLERHKAGPDYTVQAMSGPPMSRKDVVQAIEEDKPFGRVTIEAEKSYLMGFLSEIRENLKLG